MFVIIIMLLIHACMYIGLEMSVVGQEGDSQIFIIEHKPEYQKVQHQFWDAVDSMAPENLMVNIIVL